MIQKGKTYFALDQGFLAHLFLSCLIDRAFIIQLESFGQYVMTIRPRPRFAALLIHLELLSTREAPGGSCPAMRHSFGHDSQPNHMCHLAQRRASPPIVITFLQVEVNSQRGGLVTPVRGPGGYRLAFAIWGKKKPPLMCLNLNTDSIELGSQLEGKKCNTQHFFRQKFGDSFRC